MQVLLVNSPHDTIPTGTQELIREIGWHATTATDYRSALRTVSDEPVDVILLSQPRSGANNGADHEDYERLMRLVDVRQITGFMLGDTSDSRPTESMGRLDLLDRHVAVAELRGRFAMIERYHEHFRRMEGEVRNMERLGKRLNEHFREVDQEMRLAARLQQDFLPKISDPIGNLQFATIYRPATWVSGDIFDVFRIDETHTGFYVADAVGHGVAASLLTMFIKRSVVPKRVDGNDYTIATPSEAMAGLNTALTQQELPNCQFVTAWYGLINHETLTLSYARGGHPYPILVTGEGAVSPLKSSGALLGLFKDEEFPTTEVQLSPGDKVVVYTDGVELAFQTDKDAPLDTQAYMDSFQSFADQPVRGMLHSIEAQLDDERGSLNPRDDLTIVGVEVLKP